VMALRTGVARRSAQLRCPAGAQHMDGAVAQDAAQIDWSTFTVSTLSMFISTVWRRMNRSCRSRDGW
jgi:hypothetical protein